MAGERQRGTLEVLLARPISRRSLVITLFVAVTLFICLAVLAVLAGSLLGSSLGGVIDELEIGNVPVLWLNVVLLFVALASIGLAASVSFDRLAPAVGVTLGVTIVAYFLDVIGSLWPDAEGLRPWSLFYYVKAKEALLGEAAATDLLLLALVAAAALVFALVAFPRRDIAAPS